MTQKLDDINKFWHKFQKAVVDSGGSETMAIYHIKWAKKFAVSLRGKPLRSCSAGNVRRSLGSLESQEDIEPWPVSLRTSSIHHFSPGNIEP